MKVASTLLSVALFALVGCSNNENEPPQQATSAHVATWPHMSTVASDACSKVEGTIAFSRQLDGSRVGMCQLPNGRRCSETALEAGGCL